MTLLHTFNSSMGYSATNASSDRVIGYNLVRFDSFSPLHPHASKPLRCLMQTDVNINSIQGLFNLYSKIVSHRDKLTEHSFRASPHIFSRTVS